MNLGVVGCGAFGLFALQHFTQVDGVRLVGMAGTHRPAAIAAAKRFGVPDVVDVPALVQRDDIDVVYLATPPFLHYEHAMLALRAGKHVICEKPLAMNLEQAREMITIARDKGLVMIANLMQRYNPLYDMVRRLIASRVLGEPLHGYFENYAADEGLSPDHWFWDRQRSGGIFIEHGVHFFDMFTGWLGDGQVVSAQAMQRPGTQIEDQVNCTARYGEGVLVNFYHGFTQPGRIDRQELRIVFERGDITLHEWVPTVAKLRAVVDEAATRQIMDIFPQARLDITASYGGADRQARGRFKPLDIYQAIEVTWGLEQRKMHLYGQLLRSMMTDQLSWIRQREHQRIITEQNGFDSLRMAVDADRMAHGG